MKYTNFTSNLTAFLFLGSFIFFLYPAKAQVILWQVGDLNESHQEFVLTDKRIIDYQVPLEWDSLLHKGSPFWGEFPGVIYSKENNPQEIGINFPYFQDYTNPDLTIIASVYPNTSCYLMVYKDKIFIGGSLILGETFNSYTFPLAYVKKGLHEKNRIVLRCSCQSNAPVIFDTLYVFIDDTDTDGDGISDKSEGDCYLDQQSACIPLRSYNPLMINRLSLHIEKSEALTPYLREVRFFEPGSINLPDWLYYGHHLPYEFLGFRIGGIKEKEGVRILIEYMAPLYPSAQFYFYQADNDWGRMPFEFIDQFTAGIILEDGGSGDFDALADGNINTVFTLSYPESLSVMPEKRGCFVETILGRIYEKDL